MQITCQNGTYTIFAQTVEENYVIDSILFSLMRILGEHPISKNLSFDLTGILSIGLNQQSLPESQSPENGWQQSVEKAQRQ